MQRKPIRVLAVLGVVSPREVNRRSSFLPDLRELDQRIHFQRCGGGRRIIRKKVRNTD